MTAEINDSADLLLQFNDLAGRPTSGDAITDTVKYQRLTRAQQQVVGDLVSRVPFAFTPVLTLLTTADNSVFTFGTDPDGYAITPMGKVGIYENTQDFPDFAWIEGGDFINEGTQIHLMNGDTWTQPLYWYGVAMPADIDATHQPALFPPSARELIVLQAVRRFAKDANRNPDLAATMQDEYDRAFMKWCLVFRTQFRSGGALGPLTSGIMVPNYPNLWAA